MGIKWLLEKYTNRIIKIRLKYRNVLCKLYNFHISKSTIIFRILPIQFSEGEYIKALFSISWTNIDVESFNNGFATVDLNDNGMFNFKNYRIHNGEIL